MADTEAMHTGIPPIGTGTPTSGTPGMGIIDLARLKTITCVSELAWHEGSE
jgi:hypothetical protein